MLLSAQKARRPLFEEIYSRNDDYEVLKGIIPDTAEFRYFFADFLREIKKYDEAIKEYKAAIILARESKELKIESDAYSLIGILYLWQKQNGQALDNLQQAVYVSPRNAWALYNLGKTYFVMGRYEEAEDALKRAIAVEPAMSASLLYLGKVYERFKLKEKAGQYYLEAIRCASGEYAEIFKKEAEDGLERLYNN